MSELSRDGFVSEETCESDLSIGRSSSREREGEVLHAYLDQYIRLIKELVPFVPTELLFSMDESGFSDCKERMPKCVLIPTDARETTLHYPASPKTRRQTLICCVTAAGDAYCPLIVSPDPATLAVFEHQMRDGTDLQIEISLWPYVNAEIFKRYVDTVLIPAVEGNRQLPGCDKKPAILFCDNCSARMSNSMLEKLARHGVLILTYSPHTSHIFQVLDERRGCYDGHWSAGDGLFRQSEL
jgi:hypothetical protein